MAVESGTLGTVEVGAAAVSAVTAWTLEQRVEKIAASSSGSGLSLDLVGRYSADGSIDCLLDDDDATGQVLLIPGATVALTLLYTGPGTGNPSRVFNAIVNTVSETMGTDAANARTFTYWTNEQVDSTAAT